MGALTPSVDKALQRLLKGGRSSSARQDLAVVQTTLRAYLRARFPDLNASDVDDVISTTLARMLASSQRPKNPVAFMIRTAGNEALDQVRRMQRHSPSGEPEEIEEFAALEPYVDELTPRDRLLAVMRKARLAEREDLIDLLRVWLTLEWFGLPTSSRALAAELGVSHTQILRLLVDLRELLGIDP